MLRHAYNPLIVAILCSCVAHAGWDTNSWPAYENPRDGRIHSDNCYSALVERCEATETVSGQQVSNPSTPSYWRSQRGNLTSLKTKVKALLSASWYLDPAQTNADGSYSGVTSLPELDVSALCTNVGIPTNYFDYTPWRCLNGTGPFNEDATVGHPHGWTNENTAAGGSAFPGSRTKWYTTDYGWDGMYSAINGLTITKGYTLDFKAGSLRVGIAPTSVVATTIYELDTNSITAFDNASFGAGDYENLSYIVVGNEFGRGNPYYTGIEASDPGGVAEIAEVYVDHLSDISGKDVQLHYWWNDNAYGNPVPPPQIPTLAQDVYTNTASFTLSAATTNKSFGNALFMTTSQYYPSATNALGIGTGAEGVYGWKGFYQCVVTWDFEYQ